MAVCSKACKLLISEARGSLGSRQAWSVYRMSSRIAQLHSETLSRRGEEKRRPSKFIWSNTCCKGLNSMPRTHNRKRKSRPLTYTGVPGTCLPLLKGLSLTWMSAELMTVMKSIFKTLNRSKYSTSKLMSPSHLPKNH